MYLQSKPRGNLSSLEKYLLRKIEAQSIDYFPVNRALVLAEEVFDDETEETSNAIASKVN